MAGGTAGPAGLIGQVVGGYQLERVLGKGAMGAVFLGRRADVVSGEQTEEVAIKVLILPWQLDDKERGDLRARLLREAATLRKLRHPHIVAILDSGEDAASGLTYMVMPFLRGGTLADRLEGGSLPLAECADLLRQVADGLDYAHAQGVVHRDIKPANILLDERGRAYLADFSIVRLLAEVSTKLTTTGGVLGTPAYMAPEQFAGTAVGPAADLYSLGMVTYEMVTGRVAFDATTIVELIRQLVQELPPSPRMLRPELPQAAEDALLVMLAKAPGDRLGSATLFAKAFAEGLQGYRSPAFVAALAHLAAGATVLPGQIAATQRGENGYTPTLHAGGGMQHSKRKRGWLMPLVVAVLLVAVTGVAVFAHDTFSGDSGQPTTSTRNTTNSVPSKTSNPFTATSVTASISQKTFSGICKPTMTFTATATINVSSGDQGGTVSYRWIGSEGSPSSTQTLTFHPGSVAQTVSTTFSIGAALGTGATRWRAVEILSPNSLQSTHISFSLTCQQGIAGWSPGFTVGMTASPTQIPCHTPTTVTFTASFALHPAPATQFSYYVEWWGTGGNEHYVTSAAGVQSLVMTFSQTVTLIYPDQVGYYADVRIEVSGSNDWIETGVARVTPTNPAQC